MAKLGVLFLVALLLAALWWAYRLWTSVGAADLPPTLYVAMALGAGFSLLVGGGLMALMFYSSRAGYDDRASRGDQPE